MAGWKDFFMGTPEKTQQFSNLSSGGQNLQNQLTGSLGDPMNQLLQSLMGMLQGSPQSYEQFEKPLMRQFNEQIIPQLAEGFGGLGATSSSGAQNAFAGAGTDLMERLGAQRGQLQQGSMDRILQMLGMALNPTQETVMRGRSPGFLDQLGGGIGQAAGMLPFMNWGKSGGK